MTANAAFRRVLAAKERRAVQRAVDVGQPCVWLSAVSSAAEAVQHFLRAVRRDAEDRAGVVVPAKLRRAVKRALYVDQAIVRVRAVESGSIAAEAMQHFLRAVRRDAEDRAGVVVPDKLRRAVKRALYVDQPPVRINAVSSAAEAV